MQRTLRILSHICREKNGVRLSALARAFDASSPAIYKYVKGLVAEGFVFKDEVSGRFRATYRIVELAGHVERNNDLTELVYPHLLRLGNEISSSVHMAVRDGDLGVCISKVENSDAIPSITRVGMSFDLYPTALGKALLAFASEESRESYLDRISLVPYTNRTITDPEALRADLRRTSIRGYSRDDEEHRQGLHAVAVPVFDYTDTVIASISTMIPASVEDEQLLKTVEALRTTAHTLAHTLGRANASSNQSPTKEAQQ